MRRREGWATRLRLPPATDVSWPPSCHAQSACESPAKRLGRPFQCESVGHPIHASCFARNDRGACGAVAEWSKALAWKVSIGQKPIVGSNPTRSEIGRAHV